MCSIMISYLKKKKQNTMKGNSTIHVVKHGQNVKVGTLDY